VTARYLSGALWAIAGRAVAFDARAVPASEQVYVGYYQEDPLNNPEDPTMGSVYVKLPSADGSFGGNVASVGITDSKFKRVSYVSTTFTAASVLPH
jgi:hypothetical protein